MRISTALPVAHQADAATADTEGRAAKWQLWEYKIGLHFFFQKTQEEEKQRLKQHTSSTFVQQLNITLVHVYSCSVLLQQENQYDNTQIKSDIFHFSPTLPNNFEQEHLKESWGAGHCSRSINASPSWSVKLHLVRSGSQSLRKVWIGAVLVRTTWNQWQEQEPELL